MKKINCSLLLFSIFIFSCQKKDSSLRKSNEELGPVMRSCASHEVLQTQLAADPTLAARMNAIENFTRTTNMRPKSTEATLTIPVVVHVIYNTAAQNISAAQVQSQIDVLNEDFNLQNRDNVLVPSYFAGVKANVGIRFVLAQTIRLATTKTSFSTNDGMKFTRRGGSDVVDPANYLNIWVCNLGQNLLGYAQFPGGRAATDGIVILYAATGRTGTLIPNYNKGRTATHEVGHWINLRHIWGDATCGTDYVGDTPLHNTANYGCPPAGHRSTCTGTPLEMWMNYMDYTYDNCMYMFSNGQKSRMLAIFAPGGPRESIVN